jgi:hypothetical protein
MKYGYDELTAAVRSNDVASDLLGQNVNEIANGFGVEGGPLLHVASQRSIMAQQASRGSTSMALTVMFLDGFFAAMHLLEQDKPKDGT